MIAARHHRACLRVRTPARPGLPAWALAIAALGAEPASAQTAGATSVVPTPSDGAPRFGVSLDLGTAWRLDRGWQAFAPDGSGGELGIGASADLRTLRPHLVLGATAAWRRSVDSASLGPALRTEMRGDMLAAGSTLRWDVLPAVAPQAAVSLGAARWTGRILADAGRDLETVAYQPIASAGLGLLLHTPPNALGGPAGGTSTFTLALLVEGGFQVAPRFGLDLHPVDAPKDALPGRAASAGSLNPSGPYLRWSLGVRF